MGIESLPRCQLVGITLSQWKNTLNMNQWQVLVSNIFPLWGDRLGRIQEISKKTNTK